MSNVLLGGAIADALGVPFESKPADNPLLLSWDQKSFLGSQYHKLEPGQYSDDSQMSQMVAESLVDNSGFNPEDLAKRYVDWIESGRARGYGKTTLLAINNLKSGIPWTDSGVPESYGNGTAMRAAPFGVFFRNDLRSLIEIVKMDSGITHKSNEAEAGALAIALAAYYISNEDTDQLVKRICESLPDSIVKNKLKVVPLRVKSAVKPLIMLDIIGTKADVRQTVPAVFYCYLKFEKFSEAITYAIRAGFDTDTTAAIVGALIGARDGVRGMPREWIDGVEDKDKLMILDSKLVNRNKQNYLISSGSSNV